MVTKHLAEHNTELNIVWLHSRLLLMALPVLGWYSCGCLTPLTSAVCHPSSICSAGLPLGADVLLPVLSVHTTSCDKVFLQQQYNCAKLNNVLLDAVNGPNM